MKFNSYKERYEYLDSLKSNEEVMNFLRYEAREMSPYKSDSDIEAIVGTMWMEELNRRHAAENKRRNQRFIAAYKFNTI